MPKYLLDTNACIAIRNSFRKGGPKDAERRAAMERLIARWRGMAANDIAMSFISLGELALWTEKHANPPVARALLQQLKAAVPVLGANAAAGSDEADRLAHGYAEIRHQLERQGQGIGSNDLWIAAHARALGMTVVTGNTSEFKRVEGLAVEDWTT